ncbi:MAG: hypothetical protein LASZOEIN_002493 [Candidatus Fervidibacter sp.]|jgi:hypothetical protein
MVVHVRWQGRSYEWTNEELALPERPDEEELFAALAQRLETDVNLLKDELVVDWGEEAVVLRPKAIFG